MAYCLHADSLVSTYVVCERLSVMHEPAGVVENLVQNSTVYPYSAIQNTPPPKWKLSEILALWLFSCRIPPPPENWNLGRSWHFVISQLQNTPTPHPQKLKFRQILALCDFSVAEYTPPKKNWNLGRSWHFVIFQLQNTPPPRKLKFRQILALCDFSVAEYTPPKKNWNLGRSWHFVIFQLQNTPPPPPKIEI